MSVLNSYADYHLGEKIWDVLHSEGDMRNEEGPHVVFQDGGSGASFISASKLVDAVAMLP